MAWILIAGAAAALAGVGVAAFFYVKFTRLRRRHLHLSQLYKLATILQGSPDLASVGRRALREISAMFRAHKARLVLVDIARTSEGVIFATSSAIGDRPREEYRVSEAEQNILANSAAGPAIQDGEVIAPLATKEFVFGFLAVRNEKSTFKTDSQDGKLLTAVTAQLAAAASRARKKAAAATGGAAVAQPVQAVKHDPLTGLLTRKELIAQIDEAIGASSSTGSRISVLYLDIDAFKEINDRHGQRAGDEVLCTTAEIIKRSIRVSDPAARLSGDEYAVMLLNLGHADETDIICHRIIDGFSRPMALAGRTAKVSASLGVVTWSGADGPASASDLLERAEMAMKSAKGSRKNSYANYSSQGVALENDDSHIQAGIARGEFCLHWQPVIDLATGRISSFEGLARWMHPTRGWLLPEEFIGRAERSNLANALGAALLREACNQWHSWYGAGADSSAPIVSVNVSPRHCTSPTFMNEIGKILADSGVRPSHLMLELSARAVSAEPDVTLGRLQVLREIGVKIAIDNFGVDTISLQGLHGHGFDVLKIDGRLIAQALTPSGRGIMDTIVQMSAAMNVELSASGVEHSEWISALRDRGVVLGQGIAIARPVPAERLQALIAAGRVEDEQFAAAAGPATADSAVDWLVDAMGDY